MQQKEILQMIISQNGSCTSPLMLLCGACPLAGFKRGCYKDTHNAVRYSLAVRSLFDLVGKEEMVALLV